jgi:hypothetical protein
MIRLVALILLAPAVAASQETVLLSITNGSMVMQYGTPESPSPSAPFAVAGPDFSAAGAFIFAGKSCCNPLDALSPEPPDTFFRFGFSTYLERDGGSLEASFTVNSGLGVSEWDPNGISASVILSEVFLKGPGTYSSPFSFSIEDYPDNTFPPGSVCPRTPCGDFLALGSGTATLDVVPFPNAGLPNALLVDQVTFNFKSVPEPSTVWLMLVGLAALVSHGLASGVRSSKPRSIA